MPDVPVNKKETQLLECGCNIDEALLEMVFVKLGIIGEEVAKERMANGEKSGWKCMSRPERERILKGYGLVGVDLDQLIMMIQE